MAYSKRKDCILVVFFQVSCAVHMSANPLFVFLLFLLLFVKSSRQAKENEIPDTGGEENKTDTQPESKSKGVLSTFKVNENLICPNKDEGPPKSISMPCKSNGECRIFEELCCQQRCRKGVEQKVKHRPLLGIVARDCPTNPVSEVLPIRRCQEDSDCWPRICCPDGEKHFCRTPMPLWANARPLAPLRAMMAYVQCTPPPPPVFDLFPKPCRSPIDCFPNLCCQEGDKKFCRPPKKSLLALVDTVSKMFGSGK